MPAIAAMVLGMTLIASSLAQNAGASHSEPPVTNRTAAAIAAFQDLTPPGGQMSAPSLSHAGP